MAKQISITVSEGTTIVKEVFNGKTAIFASNTNRNYLPVAGGVKIMPNSEEAILNNYVILIADLVNDGIDFTGVATSEDLIAKLAINQAFKYGGAINKKKSVENEYATIALLLAAQLDQAQNAIQFVEDASADPTVDAGFAYYEYLGTTLGTLADYRKLSEEESMDIAPLTLQKVTDNGNHTTHIVEVEGVKFNNLASIATVLMAGFPQWSPYTLGSTINNGAYDSLGNLYLVADFDQKVYKITLDGVISVFAAINMQPHAIIIRNDILYITGNTTEVVRIDMTGTVTINPTPVALQTFSMSMDSLGNIFFFPYLNSASFYKMDMQENITLFFLDATIPATNVCSAIDSLGNLYFSGSVGDVIYYAINKISPLGVFSVFANTALNGGSSVFRLFIDSKDNVYSLEGYYGRRLQKTTPLGDTTTIKTFPDRPDDMVGYGDKIWVVTRGAANYYVNEVNLLTGVTTVVYVGGTGIPGNIFYLSGDIYISNTTNKNVEKVQTNYVYNPLTLDDVGNIIKEENIVISAGILSAPNTLIEKLTKPKDLLTKEYADANYTGVQDFNEGLATSLKKIGMEWIIRESAADNDWYSVTYGNGLFVAVSSTGVGNRVMTSPDGINWTIRVSAADNEWKNVTYGNGLFVAIASTGVGNRVMTSPDGINWTIRVSAADNYWSSVTYGNGLFVAVSYTGVDNRVMTSPDGINWTSRTILTNNAWFSVTYGNGLFVAVAYSGIGNRVMTSPDGINWTIRVSAADNAWYSVIYGNGLFVAVASDGVGNRVMTSGVIIDYELLSNKKLDIEANKTSEIFYAPMKAIVDWTTTTTIENVTLLVANWTLVSGMYEYNYANALILATSVVDIIPYESSTNTILQAEIETMVVTAVGTLKIKAKYLPKANILIAINLNR